MMPQPAFDWADHELAVCQGCGALVWMEPCDHGHHRPTNADGSSHTRTCPNPVNSLGHVQVGGPHGAHP